VILIAQLLLSGATIFEIVLTSRFNLSLGIPDGIMLFGDDAFLAVIIKAFKQLPVLVICSDLCPDGNEATMFATLMSLVNIGGHYIAPNLGAYLAWKLGVSRGNYENLPWLFVFEWLHFYFLSSFWV